MPRAICFVRLYGAHSLVSKMYLLVPLDSEGGLAQHCAGHLHIRCLCPLTRQDPLVAVSQ